MMLDNKFWDKVKISDTNFYEDTPCLEWTASLTTEEYGRFWLNGKLNPAHRIVYEDAEGVIPDGLELDHLCRNRKCCNPNHLDPVTHQENSRRGLGGFITEFIV